MWCVVRSALFLRKSRGVPVVAPLEFCMKFVESSTVLFIMSIVSVFGTQRYICDKSYLCNLVAFRQISG